MVRRGVALSGLAQTETRLNLGRPYVPTVVIRPANKANHGSMS
jgi:hypothetical protein